MKTTFKKAISVLLVAVMMLSIAPLAGFVGLELPEINLFGTKAEAATSGTCGENLTWTLDESTGELVISGTGAMSGWSSTSPWYSYRSLIKSATIVNGVTSIGPYAFYACDSLASITIPDSVTTIGGYAFYSCDKLESVTIPDSVTTIGECAFNHCNKLISVTIGKGVTTIGNYAFSNCTSLEGVTIPDSVTSIGIYAFFNCSSFKNVTIPAQVRSIGEYAFALCSDLENITISNGVSLTIGKAAFALCSSLESVTIPASVRSLGDGVFSYCENLKKITVSSANKEYSSDEHGVLFSKNKVKLIQYPAGNTSSSYIIPNSVTNIALVAFALCTNLESVSIPKNTVNIGDAAFYGCTSLQDVYYGGSRTNWENVIIDVNNDPLTAAEIHYNSAWSDAGSTETPDNIPDYDSSVKDSYLVPTPTETKISYGDSIVLHVDPSKIPEGGYVEWYPSNGNFGYSVSADGTTCTITPDKKGDTTFTAIVYDADGNIVSADEQTMTSKAGFFDKIIAFFKRLFGLTKTIPEAVKVIC